MSSVEIEFGLENAANAPASRWELPREEPPNGLQNPALVNMTKGATARLIAHGSSATQAAAQAHGMVYTMIQRQVGMLAFIDNFKMLGVVFFAVIPFLLLMKKPRMMSGEVPVH
jgi:hypothetical protein